MELAGHARFPTNSQGTFLPSGPPAASAGRFPTSPSLGERLQERLQDQGFCPRPEWQLAEPRSPQRWGDSLSWVPRELGGLRGRQGQLSSTPACTLLSISRLTPLRSPPRRTLSTDVTDEPLIDMPQS